MKYILYSICIISLSFTLLNEKVKTLKNTVWSSTFFHYHNEYHFITDSTGYSFDGQRAFSLPLDSSDTDFETDKILYNDSVNFKYKLKDSLLTITYLTKKPKREFKISTLKNNFAFQSLYKYAYGYEYLEKGKIDSWKK
tara:strand:+ start:16 stop:432 length:417 start_codon:yes stop_codon:yes gene_type:complete